MFSSLRVNIRRTWDVAQATFGTPDSNRVPWSEYPQALEALKTENTLHAVKNDPNDLYASPRRSLFKDYVTYNLGISEKEASLIRTAPAGIGFVYIQTTSDGNVVDGKRIRKISAEKLSYHYNKKEPSAPEPMAVGPSSGLPFSVP